MSPLVHILVRNFVIAATLGLAAVASWAVTEFRGSAVEVSAISHLQG